MTYRELVGKIEALGVTMIDDPAEYFTELICGSDSIKITRDELVHLPSGAIESYVLGRATVLAARANRKRNTGNIDIYGNGRITYNPADEDPDDGEFISLYRQMGGGGWTRGKDRLDPATKQKEETREPERPTGIDVNGKRELDL